MVNTYQLLNPYIEGLFEDKIKARNSKEAAHIFYKSLSEHFNNSIPAFYFTIQKGGSGEGKIFNFQVKETKVEDKVNFKISNLKVDINEETLNKFKMNLDKMKDKLKKGGSKKKHHKKDKDGDSSSSSSSDTDSDYKFYKRASKYLKSNTQPIYYWWYYPYLYPIDYVYVPTFYSYITPYIELSLVI